MKRFRLILILALAISAAPIVQGCSSQNETTQTTTTADPAAPATTSSQTTTTTTTDNEPDSVLGATFHAIGTIIAFPFRLIGDAVGLLV